MLNRTTVVVQSEFGRRLFENADGGTDHGHGNVMLVASGNAVPGIHGTWPGLANAQLFDGADLEVTTDFRRVLSEILIRRMGNNKLGRIFPGYGGYAPLGVVSGPDLTPDYSVPFSRTGSKVGASVSGPTPPAELHHRPRSPGAFCYIDAMKPTVCWIALVLGAAATIGAADLPVISHGERVALNEHTVNGKLTLFDFYADWCGPCRALEPAVARLAESHPEQLAVRKVDISNWNTPVASQYGIRSIPHLKLYGPDGRLIVEGDARRVMAEVDRRLGSSPRSEAPRRARSSSPVVPILLASGIVGVVAVVILGRGSKKPPAPPPPAAAPHETAVGGSGWFAMIQSSLQGPYDDRKLRDMMQRGVITGATRIRRRGETAWRTVDEVLD
jgi:thiol-disulfide isomerase/thioredoxin